MAETTRTNWSSSGWQHKNGSSREESRVTHAEMVVLILVTRNVKKFCLSVRVRVEVCRNEKIRSKIYPFSARSDLQLRYISVEKYTLDLGIVILWTKGKNDQIV
jgi:hypothetical protein